MAISQEDLDDLRAKLDALDLSDEQRKVLHAILRIAWDLVGDHRDLEKQFDGCFEPLAAEALLVYPGGSTNNITKSVATAHGTVGITRTIHE